jgi:hypothetical protein
MTSSLSRLHDHTFRHTTLGRTPLEEWPARHRDLYLTTHNTHKIQTNMPPAGFEPTIPTSVRPQTHVLERATTGISSVSTLPCRYSCITGTFFVCTRKYSVDCNNIWYWISTLKDTGRILMSYRRIIILISRSLSAKCIFLMRSGYYIYHLM